MKLRPFNGRSEIRLSVSIVPRDEVSVCSKGAVAVTSTDSVVEPTCRVRFTRTTWLTPTPTFGSTAFLKPCFSTVTEYAPMRNTLAAYAPELSVEIGRASCRERVEIEVVLV